MVRSEGAMGFLVDFSALTKFLGAAEALAESGDDNLYLDMLAQSAFATTEAEFNADAAAYAAAGGIKHMYEWGTIGINRARSSTRPTAMSPAARLWGTNLKGTGLNQNYSYYFKPSLGTVPKPTMGRSGMSAANIRMLRDQWFRNKAAVFELGETVSISPRNAQFLIIPIDQDNISPNARPSDVRRGYTMTKKTIVMTPGKSVQGNFTAFWSRFWEGTGNARVNEKITAMMEEDFEPDIMVNSSGTLRPAQPGSITAAIKTERARVSRNARRRAAYRLRRDKEIGNA